MDSQVSKDRSYKKYIILSLFFLMLISLPAAYYFMVSNSVSNNGEDQFSEEFITTIDEFSKKFSSGDIDGAITTANDLLKVSDTEIEQGRANLTLALAEREIDQVAATERFKMISRTEDFHPFTRAMASWYVVELYLGSRDSAFARDHIYTGEMWSKFVDTTYTDDPELMYRLAAIEALKSALDLHITPRIVMRLATESAALLQYNNFTDQYKNETATLVEEYIAIGDLEIASIKDQNSLNYAGAEYVTIVSALNSKALALDALYTDGYITDRSRVVSAYDDAIRVVIEYNIRTDHQYFVRYNYADFLARSNEGDSQNEITSILSPFATMTEKSSFNDYVRNQFANEFEIQRTNRYTGHPETMRLLADISPEFRNTLLLNGISETVLSTSDTTDAGGATTIEITE